VPAILVQILIKNLNFRDCFSNKNCQMSDFMKIRPVRAELFHADGRTDTTKLIVAFRNLVNAPKKKLSSVRQKKLQTSSTLHANNIYIYIYIYIYTSSSTAGGTSSCGMQEAQQFSFTTLSLSLSLPPTHDTKMSATCKEPPYRIISSGLRPRGSSDCRNSQKG